MKGYMSISEFARISAVCRKTLIWYDNTGLFSPAFTDSKGYRHYSYEQIYTISVIQMLLELGASHAQIKEYMKSSSPSAERQMLMERKAMIGRQMDRLACALDVISTRLEVLDEAEGCVAGLTLRHLAASPVFISRNLESIPRSTLSDDVWMDFYTTCEENGNGFGYPEGFMVAKEDVESGHCDRIIHIVSYVGDRKHANGSMPEGDYAVYYGQGNLDDTSGAYRQISSFIAEHGLVVAGPAWEKRLIDESGAKDRLAQRIRIAVPVSEA